MVSTFLLFALLFSQPFDWECPDTVVAGQTFSLRISTSETGCSGIVVNDFRSTPGIRYRGSSTSTSISSVTTPSGRQLTSNVVLDLMLVASGEGHQTIGPLEVTLRSVGTYTLNEFPVYVVRSGVQAGSGTGRSAPSQRDPNGFHNNDDVWIEAIPETSDGFIYPGTRLFVDYYVCTRIPLEDISYSWQAPELGLIVGYESFEDSEWQSEKYGNALTKLLARLEISPAAPGSLLAPLVTANVTLPGYSFGNPNQLSLESRPLVIPVYPFPDNPPDGWDGTLLDSVSVRVEQLPNAPGQGGELTLRVTCLGPGRIYVDRAPEPTLHGEATLIPAGSGSSTEKKWWDFILEPKQTGTCVLGPDTLVWLDRINATYKFSVVEPCSLQVTTIPRPDREIELEPVKKGISPLFWVFIAVIGVTILTIGLGFLSRHRDKRLASVSNAGDLDELITGLETELSKMLTGRKEYMGYEELSEFLDQCDTDSLLSRRILRFWRDLENSLSDKQITGDSLKHLKKTAHELLRSLEKDLQQQNKE